MSDTTVAPVLPVFRAVLNEGTAPLGKENVEVPLLEFFTDGNTHKRDAKRIHSDYATAAKARKLNGCGSFNSRRTVKPAAKPFTGLEKEWSGATVTFTDALKIPTNGPEKDENGQNVPFTKILSEDDFTGTVVGLSGNAETSLSVYVPGDGFYCVKKNELTRVI